jgi:hypothetical protein
VDGNPGGFVALDPGHGYFPIVLLTCRFMIRFIGQAFDDCHEKKIASWNFIPS